MVGSCFSSCSILLTKMYGKNKIKYFNEKEYGKFVSKIREKNECVSMVSDTVQYQKLINLGNAPYQKNNFAQPIQLLYFEKGKLVSYHSNCYVPGSLFNLRWNADNQFSVFPPKSPANLDSTFLKLSEYKNIYSKINADSEKKWVYDDECG